MPLYGRAFGHTDGLGCAFHGHGGDSDGADGVGGSWEAGVWDYKALPRPGAAEEVDEEVGASWSFDEGRRVLVSYDNVRVAGKKAGFIGECGLGGGMWWESSGDRSGVEGRSLIATVCLCFSFSRFSLFLVFGLWFGLGGWVVVSMVMMVGWSEGKRRQRLIRSVDCRSWMRWVGRMAGRWTGARTGWRIRSRSTII